MRRASDLRGNCINLGFNFSVKNGSRGFRSWVILGSNLDRLKLIIFNSRPRTSLRQFHVDNGILLSPWPRSLIENSLLSDFKISSKLNRRLESFLFGDIRGDEQVQVC